MVRQIELKTSSHSPLSAITACAPNRRRVATACFASSTHGATCRRDLSVRLSLAQSAGKIARASRDWFWFSLSLVDKLV